MKDFHSYSITIYDASWNQFAGKRVPALSITKSEELNVCGRATLETVLDWIDASDNEIRNKIDEMKSKAADGRVVISARLPIRENINGECFHQSFDNLPSDATMISDLKEKVSKYYQSED